ncbi:MAG: IclR family transcriptional regulator, partial [Lachnospiraceae bacterium]|nr:IclR family transcriptional regulator [Lachnospiraceae bacterium]
EFMEKIQDIRSLGYALDDEENELGVRCIAACLKDYRGRARYAFSISAPVTRMSDERLHELAGYVLKRKEEINREIR